MTRNPVVFGATMTGLGGLLIVLGSFLPWLTATVPFAGTISTNGMEGGGDGILTLALGVLTVLIGVAQLTANLPARLQLSAVVTGVLTGLLAIAAYSSVQERIETAKGESDLIVASVGSGIWTLFVGAAFAIAGGVFARPRNVRTASSDDATGVPSEVSDTGNSTIRPWYRRPGNVIPVGLAAAFVIYYGGYVLGFWG